MTDLTSTLSTLLIEKHAAKPVPSRSESLTKSLDTFLQEAYQINKSISSLLTYLRAIRHPYLSTAPQPRRTQKPNPLDRRVVPGFGEIPNYLTDVQREDIDSTTSTLLRDINASITNLSNAATLQHDTARQVLEKRYGKPSGILWRWAAGDGADEDAGKTTQQLTEEGVVKGKKMFREGVLWYLNNGLRGVVGLQQGMVEVRLERERERRESILYDSRNRNVRLDRKVEDDVSNDYGNIDLRGRDQYRPELEQEAGGTVNGFSDEQLQLFEEENSSLMNHYNETLSKVTQAEKSLMEISSLQQTLVGHLSVQGELIEQLVDDASRTDENVRRGNKELKKASERGSTARLVFYSTVGLCSFLVVWDLIF